MKSPVVLFVDTLHLSQITNFNLTSLSADRTRQEPPYPSMSDGRSSAFVRYRNVDFRMFKVLLSFASSFFDGGQSCEQGRFSSPISRRWQDNQGRFVTLWLKQPCHECSLLFGTYVPHTSTASSGKLQERPRGASVGLE
jgi:hypothetical protein